MKPTTRALLDRSKAHQNHPDRYTVARILSRLKKLGIVPDQYLIRIQAVCLGLCFGMQGVGLVSLTGCAGTRVETVATCSADPIACEWELEVEARASWEAIY